MKIVIDARYYFATCEIFKQQSFIDEASKKQNWRKNLTFISKDK